MKGKSFRSGRLEDVAIQSAFKKAVANDKREFLESRFNNPAITRQVFADAIFETAMKDRNTPLFQWLLSKADSADLKEVQKMSNYKGLKSEFRTAIVKALEAAAPGGTRIQDIERMGLADKTIKPPLPTTILDIVGSYLTDEPILKPKAKATKKTTVKDPSATKTESPRGKKRKERGKSKKGKGRGKKKKKGGKGDEEGPVDQS